MSEKLEMDIEQKVLLLAIYTAENNRAIEDSVKDMIASGVFDKKTGKKYLKNLKQLNYLNEEGLTMLGISKGKEVEMEFKV
jgi:hypothetical protein